MTSPSPTQAPPTQAPPPIPENKPTLRPENKPTLPAERKPVGTTPAKRRVGQTRTARILKGILRPFFKALYYLSTWIKKHKLSSLAIIVLLIGSIIATNSVLTGESPLSSIQQRDPFNFPYKGGKGEGNQVQNWLFALRDGDTTHLQYLDKDMAQPPDPAQLVAQFSQTKTHLMWGEANVVGVQQQPDTTIDSFVQVPLSANGPGTTSKGIITWHFVTATTASGRDVLVSVDMVSLRALQS